MATTERLTQRTREDIYTSVNIKLLGYAMTRRAYDTGRVRLVHHNQCVIFLGKLANLVHRSDIAVHGEHAVRGMIR